MLRLGRTRYKVLGSSNYVAVASRNLSSSPRSSFIPAQKQPVAKHMTPLAESKRLPWIIHQTSFTTKSPNALQQNNKNPEKSSQDQLHSRPKSDQKESSGPLENPLTEHGGGIKAELKIVQETLSLSEVPKAPYLLGLAGTLPYLGTSVSTVYLAWVLNTKSTGSSVIFNNLTIDKETASQLLAMIEPIQLGYGAVIISFLGAIHWGLEYAEKVPDRTRSRFRYGMGVAASIAAWPTLFMPIEFALTSQFAAFVALYLADSQATVRGWAPFWYSTYRFALTAMVGVAISISLIGRAKVGNASPRFTGLSGKFHEHHGEEHYTQEWQDLEQTERQKTKKKAKEKADKDEKEARERKQENEREQIKAHEEDNSDNDKDKDLKHIEEQ